MDLEAKVTASHPFVAFMSAEWALRVTDEQGSLALCRFHSKQLALQIKAAEEGLLGTRYGVEWMNEPKI
jgi:hypothetical protein